MAGWKTKGATIVRSLKYEPTDGPFIGAPLNWKWEMLTGELFLTATPALTTTPAWISYRPSTSAVGNNTAIGVTTSIFPHVRCLSLPVSTSAKVVRLSASIANVPGQSTVDSPSRCVFCVTDHVAGRWQDSAGYIELNRRSGVATFGWGGRSTSLTITNWHDPGIDNFRCGIELDSDGNANGYVYKVEVGEPSGPEEINLTKLVLIDSFPRTLRDGLGPVLYPGCYLRVAGDAGSAFFMEEGNPPDKPPEEWGTPPPLNPYGLYKTQTTLHGLLNNARLGA